MRKRKKGWGFLKLSCWKRGYGRRMTARNWEQGRAIIKRKRAADMETREGNKGERIRSRNCKQYCREQGGRKRAGEKDAREEG